jgi:hypothetical protein
VQGDAGGGADGGAGGGTGGGAGGGAGDPPPPLITMVFEQVSLIVPDILSHV